MSECWKVFPINKSKEWCSLLQMVHNCGCAAFWSFEVVSGKDRYLRLVCDDFSQFNYLKQCWFFGQWNKLWPQEQSFKFVTCSISWRLTMFTLLLALFWPSPTPGEEIWLLQLKIFAIWCWAANVQQFIRACLLKTAASYSWNRGWWEQWG